MRAANARCARYVQTMDTHAGRRFRVLASTGATFDWGPGRRSLVREGFDDG
ncbi:hypothetical protein [Streptomyces sp. C184]|uniref:hypothetical protein n=1 Tax=Streptomyces sp. C184 TaxID=3237121 RepID=UPI0034C68637